MNVQIVNPIDEARKEYDKPMKCNQQKRDITLVKVCKFIFKGNKGTVSIEKKVEAEKIVFSWAE